MSKAKIYYHDIGDYLSREEKLKIIKDFKSMSNLPFKILKPNEHGDWINKRNDAFETFIPMAPEKKFDMKSQSFFIPFSLGVGSNRDAWVYNSSRKELEENISRSIDFYNEQRIKFQKEKEANHKVKAKDFLEYDLTKLNWTDSVIRDLEKDTEYKYSKDSEFIGLYRPFFKQRMYFSKELNHRRYQQDKIFPTNKHENKVISICGTGVNKDFSALLTNVVPDLQLQANGQAFPLYYYVEREKNSPSLFDAAGESEYIRRDGVSDFIWERAKKQYGKNVSKEDIFYYVYGILHSEDYRNAFENDLKKMLPRLPLVEDVRDFWKFSKAGRKLADLHLNYEEVPPYEGVEVSGASEEAFQLNPDLYKVQKMRFPKRDQKDKIIYNSKIVLNNIPEKAYEYVVNGKSAIEWIMDRYQVKTDKKSGITNDPNDWAKEHDKPRYILDLLLSIINVSVQTMDIVESLPKLDFDKETEEDVL